MADVQAKFIARYEENLKNISLTIDWQPGNYAMIANFVVKNAGTLPIKDLALRCDTYAKSGTKSRSGKNLSRGNRL